MTQHNYQPPSEKATYLTAALTEPAATFYMASYLSDIGRGHWGACESLWLLPPGDSQLRWQNALQGQANNSQNILGEPVPPQKNEETANNLRACVVGAPTTFKRSVPPKWMKKKMLEVRILPLSKWTGASKDWWQMWPECSCSSPHI
jgi:hypothetical protein